MGVTFLTTKDSAAGRQIAQMLAAAIPECRKVIVPPEGMQPFYSAEDPQLYYMIVGNAKVAVDRQQGFLAIGGNLLFRAVIVPAGIPVSVTALPGAEIAIFEGDKVIDKIIISYAPMSQA